MSQEKLEIELGIDVKDTHFIFTQKTQKSIKILDYDYKRCNGCCICVNICPKNAIEAGPLIEIATGFDAPPIIIDHTKCSFCGMCSSFCPMKAIKMELDKEFPHLDSGVIFNDKCLPCIICKKACPENAIEIEFKFSKKEDFKENVKGEILIDKDKCTLCGVCAEFCPAFLLLEKESKADDLMPFTDILVDTKKCDYCGLCVSLCPEEAISVKGEFDVNEIKTLAPKLEGSIKVNDDKCTRCGWCEKVCPYDAAKVTKPFEGEIKLIDEKLKGCDPIGCHGCFNVCPSRAWIIPKDKKIDVVKDLCTYCGACEKACHVKAIGVKRTDVKYTKIPDASWGEEWKKGIKSLTEGKRERPDISRSLSLEKVVKKNEEIPINYEVNNELRKVVNEKIEKLSSLLKDKRTRRIIERKVL